LFEPRKLLRNFSRNFGAEGNKEIAPEKEENGATLWAKKFHF